MEKIENIGIQAIISAALAAFASYLGALAVPIIVLMVMMIIDYLSGMSAAWSGGTLSSKVGAKGIVKKVGYMALIVVAMGVDYLIYSGIAAADIMLTVFMNAYSMDGLHWNENFHKEYIYPRLKNAVINHAIAKP